MQVERAAAVGFIGLGTMGDPMARNLCHAGIPVVVWNRTANKAETLAAAGAVVAQDVGEVFAQAQTIILMLGTQEAVDTVLARGTPPFGTYVSSSTIVQMGTLPANYSLALAQEIEAAGGTYVEAPVSGSRGPAQAGQLVALTAGPAEAIERLVPLLQPMCRTVIPCGPVPQAMVLKIASNHLVYTMLVGLAETVHLARRQGVDPDLLLNLLSVGPMSSDLVRMKLPKLIASEFSAQASLATTAIGIEIVRDSARHSGAATPLCDACAVLVNEPMDLGLHDYDAIGVVRAIEARANESR